jgi:hypothetical protein
VYLGFDLLMDRERLVLYSPMCLQLELHDATHDMSSHCTQSGLTLDKQGFPHQTELSE